MIVLDTSVPIDVLRGDEAAARWLSQLGLALWQQTQRVGVGGAHDAEVPAVERCDLGLVKSLGKRDEACVDNPETEVGVLALKCCAACQVSRGRLLGAVGAAQEILKEHQPHLGAQPFMAPVVELGEDQAGDDEVFGGFDEQRCAPRVVLICGIQRREKRTGVEDQRHYVGGRAIGSAVTSAAVRPSSERPIPTRGRRAARMLSALSSTASASTAVRATPRRRASPSMVASESALAARVVRRRFTN